MLNKLDAKVIDTIRFLSIDGIEKAKSGHPGLPMGAAAMAWVLWKNHLQLNPQEPDWIGRDRFVLSAGHGSMLLYSLLHLFGYPLSLEDLQQFRQWKSKTPGHPEYDLDLGIETTTGPLGQGFATGVGMAMASKYLQARISSGKFSPFSSYVYSICGDGDLQEGVSSEAASLAGHLGLGNMIYLYDDNSITIDGPTALSFTEDVAQRFEAYKWQVLRTDGYDLETIDRAIQKAKETSDAPSLIIVKTHIGYGSPNKQDSASVHGSPLGEEELKLTREKSGWPIDKTFIVDDDVRQYLQEILSVKTKQYKNWQSQYDKLDASIISDISLYKDHKKTALADEIFPHFQETDKLATRAVSGKIINSIAKNAPFLWGGSADLAPSNNTLVNGERDFTREDYGGRNIHFGVREHAMGSIANGIALYGGIIPYIGTFLVFSDYMRPAIRLAAMMQQQVIYVFTHDSIGLGEDGPTHQPVEHITALRTIPGLTVMRPGDANETVEAWKFALSNAGPTALILTRQGLPTITNKEESSGLRRGAYVLWQADNSPNIAILASGSEVNLALNTARLAYKELNISCRVISMPSWELFNEQEQAYRNEVLPDFLEKRIAVEAGIGMGWSQFGISVKYSIFMRTFGASAPGSVLFENLGFSESNLLENIKQLAGE